MDGFPFEELRVFWAVRRRVVGESERQEQATHSGAQWCVQQAWRRLDTHCPFE